jgi:hypothetical protein
MSENAPLNDAFVAMVNVFFPFTTAPDDTLVMVHSAGFP